MRQDERHRLSQLLILRPHPWTYRPRAGAGVAAERVAAAVGPPVLQRPPSARGAREHSVRVEPQEHGCWRAFLRRF